MTAMNQNQLRAIFHYLKVPASAYDLGNNMRSILVYLKVPEDLYNFSAGYFGTNCYSMEWTAQGWEVFFAVNGEKCDVTVFDSETDACLDLLYKVMHR